MELKRRQRKNGGLRRLWMALLCLALALTGCAAGAGQPGNAGSEEMDGRPLVVTTLFPYYDFVRQLAGDRVRLKLIVPAGMDSHSFEPTPADMITISQADVLICNGGEMEQWVEQVLDSMDTSRMRVLTMMDYVETVEEQLVEGMEDSGHEAETHAHAAEGQASFGHDGHENEIAYDEHIWTSPANAMKIVAQISQTLSEADPADQAFFARSRDSYLASLQELDDAFRDMIRQSRLRMFVVADKFPFRYFADEFGLTYRAAFSGCSSDTEPSAKTIAYLIDRVKEYRIPAVYYLELSSHRTAEIISEETGAKPLLLHSCHNVTRREFDEGVTYLQLMRQNLENLRQGLS